MTERVEEIWPGEREFDDDREAEEPPEDAEPEQQAEPEPAEEEHEEGEEAEEVPAEEDELPRLPASGEHVAGELDVPRGYNVVAGEPSGGRRAVGVVVARFNGGITNRLLEAAFDELEHAGVAREAVTVVPVPGAFELPLAAMALAKTRRYACVVALGAVVRGETPHFDYVAGEAASGLQLAALETGIPVAFGVLTCDTDEQAEERVGKGADAVRSALEMADLFSRLRTAAATA